MSMKCRAIVGAAVLGCCALTVLFVVRSDSGATTLSRQEMSSLFGATSTCGCALEVHEDCKDPDEVCVCAQTIKPPDPQPWPNPTCSGQAVKRFWGGIRDTCKNGDKTKHCHTVNIKCWIEYFCTTDGEPLPYRECNFKGTKKCVSGLETVKCVDCKYGTPTGFELPTVQENCVTN